MPRNFDPTRTTLLRRKWMTEIRKRVLALRQAIRELLVDQDALGMQDTLIQLNVERQAWRFQTSGQKLESFKTWLQDQVDQGILEVDGTGKPWTNTYVHSAYKKGAVRAYIDTHKEDLAGSPDFYQGSQAQFLQSAFAAPETISKLSLLYTRAFDQLKGFTDQMSQETGRILATGIANGWHPTKTAREMSNAISGLSKKRALTIARTETIYAHAEGQLDAFEKLGVDEVGVMAEWSTAGDDRVCDLCAPLEGTVLPVDEAKGMIPRHPNCRCAWIPANVGEKGEKQKVGREADTAIKKSIVAELPQSAEKRTVKAAKARSTWIGKDIL